MTTFVELAPCYCNVIVRVVFAGPLCNFLSFISAILQTPKKVKLQEFIMMINPKTHTFPNLLRGSGTKPQVAGYWQEATDRAPSGGLKCCTLAFIFSYNTARSFSSHYTLRFKLGHASLECSLRWNKKYFEKHFDQSV